jgi:hypothetical protein
MQSISATKPRRPAGKYLDKKILPRLAEPIRASPVLHGALADLIRAVKENGLEGLVV